jgi:hypothetical protein
MSNFAAPVFTQLPRTTCANTLFSPVLTLTPVGANGFKITGDLTINTIGGGSPCNIEWEVENTFPETVTGMWFNTSSFSGTVDIPAGARVSRFMRRRNTHKRQAQEPLLQKTLGER